MPTATFAPSRHPARWCGGGRRTRTSSGLAAERGGGYDAERAPFGLPALAELPELAAVLEDLTAADDRLLAAVAGLADLLRSDAVETTTGVGVDHWLAAVATVTRMDRRLLVQACRLLQRLPALDTAVRRRRVSFAQLRGLTLALRSVATELDEALDRVLASLLDGLARLDRPDPDVLVRQVADAVDELAPDDLADREREAAAGRYLALQPRLDGTGGRFNGDLDASGLALLDAATTPPRELLDQPGGYGAARADTLLARLAGGCTHGHPGDDPDLDQSDHDHDRDDDDATAAPVPEALEVSTSTGTPPWWDRLPPPKLLVRLQFDTLLDGSVPAELLTDLVGGRLKLTAPAARRLLDERGALLRTIVVDDTGAVLGVGRATRKPPRWLDDVVLAVHDTCTGPGCDRPARSGQLDHAIPWWPTGTDQPFGRTDADNVGPLCGATNREKEAAGWVTVQSSAGVRTWRHPRSGLTTTTVPATWRPGGDPRHGRRHGPDDGRRHRRRPTGSDPPGPDGSGPDDLPPGSDDLPF
jgi:hypothetical protein